MLDEKDPVSDRIIAQKVIQNHMSMMLSDKSVFNISNTNNEDFVIEPENREVTKVTQVYEKAQKPGDEKEERYLTREFLKKYISFAKAAKSPEIEVDTVEYAAHAYSFMRLKAANFDQDKVAVPITVRTLETMIRLATAHAKLRMSRHVSPDDIDIALTLMNFCIFGEEMDIDDSDENEGDEAPKKKQPKTKESKARKSEPAEAKRVKMNPDEAVSDLFQAS